MTLAEVLAPPLLELITSPDVDGEHADRARFDVRSFAATEAISTLFHVKVTALHSDASIDFNEIVGSPASFRLLGHGEGGAPMSRTWTGIISQMEQTRAVSGPRAYSTYALSLVPRLWLLTQRRNYRIFQYKSELDIALEVLREWEIAIELRIDPGAYRARKYKVQYGETDYEFVYRILAEVGISYFFEMVNDETTLVLTDAPQSIERLATPLDYEDSPNLAGLKSYVTSLHRSRRVRPNRIELRDRDYRRDSSYELQAAARAFDEEKRDLALFDRRMELFYYPENFNFVDEGEDASSPYADSRGLSRTDEGEAKRLAVIDLEARRNDAYVIDFQSSDARLAPGVVFAIDGHPADEINHEKGFLVVESCIGGRSDSAVQTSCQAVSARSSYRPTLAPKPRIIGLESATVVGAAGEEIDCDEFGRVKVHFHWDRYSKRNEESSCWIPVSQTWGGAGMGGVQIPRIGQEVLVEFLAGDPDRPIVTGRVFTAVNKVPLGLPACKTQTILQSASTGHGGGHNMMRMEDKAGSEHLHMRAEKDKSVQVNNNCSTNVGSHQSLAVGGNRSTSVKGGEVRLVNGSRAKVVGGGDSLIAKGAVTVKSTTAGVSITSPVEIGIISEPGSVGIFGKAGIGVGSDVIIEIVCGGSTILMTPAAIVIDSAQVAINPGQAVLNFVRETGSLPVEPVPPAEKLSEPSLEVQKLADGMNHPDIYRSGDKERVNRRVKEIEDQYDRGKKAYQQNQQDWKKYNDAKKSYDDVVNAP